MLFHQEVTKNAFKCLNFTKALSKVFRSLVWQCWFEAGFKASKNQFMMTFLYNNVSSKHVAFYISLKMGVFSWSAEHVAPYMWVKGCPGHFELKGTCKA